MQNILFYNFLEMYKVQLIHWVFFKEVHILIDNAQIFVTVMES